MIFCKRTRKIRSGYADYVNNPISNIHFLSIAQDNTIFNKKKNENSENSDAYFIAAYDESQ